jgi:hypothetical protein
MDEYKVAWMDKREEGRKAEKTDMDGWIERG